MDSTKGLFSLLDGVRWDASERTLSAFGNDLFYFARTLSRYDGPLQLKIAGEKEPDENAARTARDFLCKGVNSVAVAGQKKNLRE